MKQRIIGFDVARALAIFGMIIVNFKMAMNADTGNTWLLWFSGLFEGRASALFVVLAGIGISFLSRRAQESKIQTIKARFTLIKRGCLLIAFGLLYINIWPADILHFYGCYFFIAALLLKASNQTLLIATSGITFLFPVLLLLFDYDQGWDWSTLTYIDMWSINGMVRHTLFNGFHPVIPWSAFLLYGLWLGRQDLQSTQFRRKAIIAAFILWIGVEAAFQGLQLWMHEYNWLALSSEDITHLFSTAAMPPMPQYILAAGSLATIIIILCLWLSERFSESKIIHALYQTGQLSLTLYIAHVFIGMGTLEALGLLYTSQAIGLSLISSLAFSLFGIIFSIVWLRYFNQGPIEKVFRKIAQ